MIYSRRPLLRVCHRQLYLALYDAESLRIGQKSTRNVREVFRHFPPSQRGWLFVVLAVEYPRQADALLWISRYSAVRPCKLSVKVHWFSFPRPDLCAYTFAPLVSPPIT